MIRAMKNSTKKILWGVLLILLGIAITLNVLDVGFTLFFDGWWTLFIILPCLYGLITGRERVIPLIGLLIGIGLLLAARDVISYMQLLRLAVPAVLIFIGVYVILRALFPKAPAKKTEPPEEKVKKEAPVSATGGEEYSAYFASEDLNFDGRDFHGAKLSVLCGSIRLDLRQAIITRDITVETNALLGSVELLMPSDVHVRVEDSSFLGDMKNHATSSADTTAPTVTVRATNVLASTAVQ